MLRGNQPHEGEENEIDNNNTKTCCLDHSVDFEYYAPCENHDGESSDKLEARIILQRQWTDWDLRLNPKFEKVLGGPGNVEPLEFEYASGL